MARDEIDLIAYKLTRIIHHLLKIEANAAKGVMYSTSSSKNDDGGLECDGRLTNDGKTLQINIPYFGVINFERGVISKSVGKISGQINLDTSTFPVSNILSPNQPAEHNQRPPSGYDGMSMMGSLPSSNLPSNTQQPSLSEEFNQNSSGDQYAELIGSMEFLRDEGDLQGIEVAFFDGLFCGAEIGGNTEDS
ncbi:hypothetical protein PENANT_c014G04217 [Penicillium antarcticum]|uniref:Uncharacterized protein n=1 Tax=Penicillium antarcticum TaxID=416450 RepID=A0A1V6Q5I9_9EURO|nr:uncharacterized protein N7508_009519 [Penicillium antarcticum]KAJ5294698.1 hypothetical protein N7508_009519 [Penicillium antarcticum]OQD84056.1 hypothetical protein PENANT_c014G04217 [Penicillium antarcticum]